MKKATLLSKADMKNILGGREQEDLCGLLGNPTKDWMCCTPTLAIHIGETDCDSAMDSCSSGVISTSECPIWPS